MRQQILAGLTAHTEKKALSFRPRLSRLRSEDLRLTSGEQKERRNRI